MRRVENAHSPVLPLLVALLVLSLALAACGEDDTLLTSPEISPTREQAQALSPTVTVSVSEAQAAVATIAPTRPSAALYPIDETGASEYAKDMGVSLQEAIRRLSLSHHAGDLRGKLEANESETLGGSWIQHEPEFRIVVLFTRDGEETIRPYIEGGPLEGLVDVFPADVTLAQLRTTQEEMIRLMRRAGLPANVGIDEWGNRVLLTVLDRKRLESELRQARVQLPQHVEIAEVPSAASSGGATVPMPTAPIAFPTREPDLPWAVHAGVAFSGKLIERDGCLRVVSSAKDKGEVIIWPHGLKPVLRGDRIVVVDGDGQVVARVGNHVDLGGKGFSIAQLPKAKRAGAFARCPRPYFTVSEIMGAKPTPRPVPALRLATQGQGGSSPLGRQTTLTGKLFEHDGCLLITTRPAYPGHTVVWPYGFTTGREDGQTVVLDAQGRVVARVGDRIALRGGVFINDRSEGSQQGNLPAQCMGPYYRVDSVETVEQGGSGRKRDSPRRPERSCRQGFTTTYRGSLVDRRNHPYQLLP